MNVYLRLIYRNIRANLDKTSIFFELIFPLFFIFVEGFGLGGIVKPFDIGNGLIITYGLFLAAGAVTLTVINGGTNAGTQLWFDRKNGMFEQILMGPFSRAQYIFSIILATLIIGIAASLLVFGIALPVLGGGLDITPFGALLIGLALFLGTIFFGAFAIALSVILKSSETFQIVSTFFFLSSCSLLQFFTLRSMRLRR
jgi:ABC-2 type transport system permease protein